MKGKNMFKAILGSLFRHLMTSAGGAVIAQGVVTADQLTQAIGAATTLIGVALSAYQKFKARAEVKKVDGGKLNQ